MSDKKNKSDRRPAGTLAGGHTPVMLREVLEILSPRDGGIYVDGTFGAGGYSRALLDQADCQVWGIDRDPNAIKAGKALAEKYSDRLKLVEGPFGSMADLLPEEMQHRVDGIALDLGVSSMQLDQAERGFSFQKDGPLDMRMEGEAGTSGGPSASEVVMTMGEEDLANVLFRYGEERQSRRIARAIIAARADKPITRTGELAGIVRAVVRKSPGGVDPATRTFQALRIYVNDELGELERGLEAAERLLAPGGRIVVVSFHSLEDRITKAFLRARSGNLPTPSRHAPPMVSPCRLASEGGSDAAFTLLFRGAKKPSGLEEASNPRARSARLRAAERTSLDAAEGREQ